MIRRMGWGNSLTTVGVARIFSSVLGQLRAFEDVDDDQVY